MGAGNVGDLGLERQTEMEYSRVAIVYSQTDSVNGNQIGYSTADVYPVPGGFNAHDPTTYNSFLLDLRPTHDPLG